ncbi:hypothetical protein V2G26_017050 [Clonostachys chloroleuca]
MRGREREEQTHGIITFLSSGRLTHGRADLSPNTSASWKNMADWSQFVGGLDPGGSSYTLGAVREAQLCTGASCQEHKLPPCVWIACPAGSIARLWQDFGLCRSPCPQLGGLGHASKTHSVGA